MTESRKITYRLFAMPMGKDSMDTAAKERFSRATASYILVYTDGDAPENSVEISGENQKRLSEQDERWLLDCNLIILTELAKAHESEIAADMKNRMEKAKEIIDQIWEQRGGIKNA